MPGQKLYTCYPTFEYVKQDILVKTNKWSIISLYTGIISLYTGGSNAVQLFIAFHSFQYRNCSMADLCVGFCLSVAPECLPCCYLLDQRYNFITSHTKEDLLILFYIGIFCSQSIMLSRTNFMKTLLKPV